MAEKLAEWIESKDCINAWAWNEWLRVCLPILYSNRNLVGSYAKNWNGKRDNPESESEKVETGQSWN